jgi:hypothetical protein
MRQPTKDSGGRRTSGPALTRPTGLHSQRYSREVQSRHWIGLRRIKHSEPHRGHDEVAMTFAKITKRQLVQDLQPHDLVFKWRNSTTTKGSTQARVLNTKWTSDLALKMV